VKGIGFGFRGPMGGKESFHNHTIREVIEDQKANAAIQGREIVPKTTVYTGR
jgi:hypothetical protein